MTSSTRTLQQYSEADQLLRMAMKYEKSLAKLAELDDVRLRKAINNSRETFTPMFKVAAVRTAFIGAATTFSRIADLLPYEDDVSKIVTEAKEKALIIRRKAVENKLVLPSGEFTEMLGITRQALNKAVEANRIFCVEVGGINYYPAFYGDLDLERRHAEKVTKALDNLLGWQKWQFFTTPKASLGGLTPIESLKKGEVEKVVIAARGFAER